MHEKRLLETLLFDYGSHRDVTKDSRSDNSSEGNKDDEEVLVDVPFIDFNSDADEETEQARDKFRRNIELKKSVIRMGKEGDNEEGEVGQPINTVEGDAENTTNVRRASTAEFDKVTGYDSEYIDSLDPRSYEDTREGSSANDARRHRSRKNNYDSNVPFKDFFIGI